MKFKYNKEELTDIIKSQELFYKSVDESMGLVLKSFEQHQVFPPLNFLIEICDARYLPFIFKNYHPKDSELENIRNQSITYRSVHEYHHGYSDDSNKDLIKNIVEDVKDVEIYENFSNNINKITTHESEIILSISQIKEFAVLNRPIFFKKEYTINVLEEIAKDTDFKNIMKNKYEEYGFSSLGNLAIDTVLNSTYEEFDSMSHNLIELIYQFLDMETDNENEMSKFTTRKNYRKNKYLHVLDEDSLILNSLKLNDILDLEHEDIYNIFEKAYNNQLRGNETNSLDNNYLITPFYNKGQKDFIRENLDYKRISQVCNNRIVFLWDEPEVIENKEIFIKESIYIDSKLSFNRDYWQDLNPEYLGLIIDGDFINNIINNLPKDEKNKKWKFPYLGNDDYLIQIMSKIVDNVIESKLTTQDIATSCEHSYILNSFFNLENEFPNYTNEQIIRTDKFVAKVLENKPVVYNLEVGKHFFDKIKNSSCKDSQEVKDSLNKMSEEATVDKVLLLSLANLSDLVIQGVKNLNPKDVIAIRCLNSSIPNEVVGNSLVPPADSSTAFYFRKHNLFDRHLVGYFFDIPGHYEKIKDTPDFNLNLEDCIKLLSMEKKISGEKFSKLIDWVAYSFENNSSHSNEISDEDIYNKINSFPQLRKFIKEKTYSYEDFLELNLKASLVNDNLEKSFTKLKTQFNKIPDDIKDNFINRYISEKGWEKQNLFLVDIAVLQKKYFHTKECEFNQFNIDKDYSLYFTTTYGVKQSPLTEHQMNFVISVMENSLMDGKYSSLSNFEKLMIIPENIQMFAQNIKLNSSVLYLSQKIRDCMKDSLGDYIFTEKEELNIYIKAIRKMKDENAMGLFGNRPGFSRGEREYSKAFWNELIEEKFSFREQFFLSLSLITEDCTLLKNDNDIFNKILKNKMEIEPIIYQLIKDGTALIEKEQNYHIIFPDLYDLKMIENNTSFISKIVENLDLDLSSFTLYIKENGSNKKVAIQFEDKINEIIKINQIKESLDDNLKFSLDCFINFTLPIKNIGEHIKLNDDRLLNLISLLKDNKFDSYRGSEKIEKFDSCIKNLLINAITNTEISEENKNLIIEITQGMKLSKDLLLSATFKDHYIRKVFLSPEVSSTIEMYALNKRIVNSFTNFNTSCIVENADTKAGDKFKI